MGWEQFSDPRPAGPDIDLDKLFINSSGEFGEKQIERGSLSGLKYAINMGETVSQETLVKNTFANLKNKAILIQNSNFENTFLGNALGQEDAGLSSIFRHNSIDAKHPNRKLYTPPKIGNLRDEAETLRATGGSIEEVSAVYNKMFLEYEREFSMKDGKSFVVELMDFSKGVFAKAAAQGHLNDKMYDANVKVDYLSRIFLNQDELHTSLSDGLQQEKIFYRLLEINEELDSGKLSRATTDQLTQLRKGARDAIKSRFHSELNNIIGEINRNGGTRLIPNIPTNLLKVDVVGPEGITVRETPRYSSMKTTSNVNEAIEHIAEKYSPYMKAEDIGEVVAQVTKTETPKIQEAAQKTVDNLVKASKVEATKVKDVSGKMPDFKASKMVKRIAIGGMVAVGGIGLIAGMKQGTETNNTKDKKEKTRSIFDMYDHQRFRSNDEINQHYMM